MFIDDKDDFEYSWEEEVSTQQSSQDPILADFTLEVANEIDEELGGDMLVGKFNFDN